MAKNNRCPLQEECEKKCTWQHHELDCPYYSVNARPDYSIEDQEEIRRKRNQEAEEEMWEKYFNEEDDEEENEEEKEPEEEKNKPITKVTYLDGPDGVTEKIKKAMYDAARQFVYIGFLLWEVQEYGYYKEHGYQSVYEYAEAELGFKKSSTKNFIAINYEFGCKDNRPYGIAHQRTISLQPKYRQFKYSQLCEMLAMSPAKRETITPDMTIKKIREIKKQQEPDLPADMETIPITMPENKLTGQTSGQITIILKLTKEEEKFIRYLLKEEISITPEKDIDHQIARAILEKM